MEPDSPAPDRRRLRRPAQASPTVVAIDSGDFSDFYRQEHDGQVRRAYLLLGSGNAAHDVVADAFIAVLRRWETIEHPGPYLNRCVLNGCHDAHRRQPRERLAAQLDPVPTNGDPSDDAGGLHGLADQLLALPFRQRAAIVLRYYGGYREAEIAELLDCRPGTVGSLIHRGLNALRDAMAAEDIAVDAHGRNRA